MGDSDRTTNSRDRDVSSSESPWQHRAPFEILAPIFTAAFEGSDNLDVDRSESKGDSLIFPIRLSQIPWVLCRVCSRWRAIARAESRLSDVTLRTTGDPGSAEYSSRSNRLFRRYRDSKLTLDWEVLQHMKFLRRLRVLNTGRADFKKTQGGDIALNPFIPHGQLTHLDLSEMKFIDPQELISLIQLCRNVTSFCYPSLVTTNDYSIDLKVLEDKGFLPSLKSAVTQNRAALSCISPPWLQLSTLNLDCTIKTVEILFILEKTPRLESLTVAAIHLHRHFSYFIPNQPLIFHDQPLIHLIDLRVIRIPQSMARLLKYLVAPKIHELSISQRASSESRLLMNIFRLTPDDISTILTFLDQGPCLESLTLDIDVDCDPGYIPQFRSIVLTDLHTLHISSKDRWLLRHLIAPRLRYVFMRWLVPLDRQAKEADTDEVLDFLESASNLGAVLLKHTFPSGTNSPVIIQLAQPRSIVDEHWWLIGLLKKYFMGADTGFLEDEYGDFIARSACALPRLELYIEWNCPMA
ncbi:hypothetical protein H0H92_013932 [Tricholoma furcatifolium]|nr:hypothetical protein H0H92_013932 [Tricholoma furcatifolium]